MLRTSLSPGIRFVAILLISYAVIYIFTNGGNTFYKYLNLDKLQVGKRLELDNLNGLNQFDTDLILYMKDFHIFPPSKSPRRYSRPYGFRVKYINESRNTMKIIQTYLKNKTHGIFVEAGANNGADEISNTLVLERDYHWSGLLIEGSPIIFPRLRAAHRRSFLSDVLLSKSTNTELVLFRHSTNPYAAQPLKDEPRKASVVSVAGWNGEPIYDFEVLSVPLYTLISAVGYKTVDFLSLDVEGTEADIIFNFPFDKVFVKTIIIEFNVMTKERTESMCNFLIGQGYTIAVRLERDIIFVHNSILEANAQ